MSAGGAIGAIVGGVIGFFVAGPAGAIYGASIGFSIGMLIDPLEPDVGSVGQPLPDKLGVTPNKIGIPIPDLLGTGSIKGNLLFYGGERNEPIYSETSGGKGGSSAPKQIAGYSYYMSWGIGICIGEVDEFYSIWQDEKCIWSGNLTKPVSGGQETIVIEDVGSVIISFGTQDQMPISSVGNIILDSTLNTPYRGLCWMYFNNCYIGKNNRMPSIRVVLRKTPELSFNTNNIIDVHDYNPIHAIWYIFNTLTGLPESWLNENNFSDVANTLNSEGRGISILFGRQQKVMDYIESINVHIDGIVLYGNDGKFSPKLIRDDYTPALLPDIDESVLLEEPIFHRGSWIDTINEMKVIYTEIINRESYTYSIMGVGYNADGWLGVGDEDNRDVFTLSVSGKEEYQIACGEEFTIIVRGDGTLWGTGFNGYGQLGLGEGNYYFDEFTQIGTDTDWAKVFGGYEQTFAIKTNGTLWATGKNESAQAGLGDTNIRYIFEQVGSDTNWDYISVGIDHSLAMKTNGTLWGAGVGENFRLSGGIAYAFAQVGTDTWSTMCAGYFFSIGIKTNGTLWAIGYNNNGQIGLDSGNPWINDWTQVGTDIDWDILPPTAGYCSFAIKTNGTLWATGEGDYGQLGLGDTDTRYVHTQVGTDTDWVKIVNSAGYFSYHSMAIKTDGSMYGSGYNYYGELGVEDKENKDVFTKTTLDYYWQDVNVGYAFTIAIKREI